MSNPETRQKMATAKIVEGTRSALQDILGEAAELYIEWDGQDKWHGLRLSDGIVRVGMSSRGRRVFGKVAAMWKKDGSLFPLLKRRVK